MSELAIHIDEVLSRTCELVDEIDVENLTRDIPDRKIGLINASLRNLVELIVIQKDQIEKLQRFVDNHKVCPQ